MLKAALVTIGIILAVGITVWITTSRLTPSINIEHRIDSLNKIDDSIKHKQVIIDSIIQDNEYRISDLEDSVSKVRNTAIIITKHYHDTITYVDKFGVHQLDSFFKLRYAY